jgi:hypothetical protein
MGRQNPLRILVVARVDTVMKKLLQAAVYIVFSLMVASPEASPPIDVTKPEVPVQDRRKKVPQIKDEDIVYQDVNDPTPKKEDLPMAKMKVTVIGRALPTRTGKPLIRFIDGHSVRVMKESKDGRWLAVQALKTGRKAWVPKVAVEVPPVKAPSAATGSAKKN